MGCRLSNFDLVTNWTTRSVNGKTVELANATYKPIVYRGKVVPSPDLGVVTLYKIDGQFKGAVMTKSFEVVVGLIKSGDR